MPLSPAQHAAITATARIAGVAFLVACGPKQAAVAPPPADVAQPAPAPADAVVTETSEVLDLETCEALAQDQVGKLGFGQEAPKDLDARVAPCCSMLLGKMEAGELPDFDARWGCCSVVSEGVGMACTPWGPPSPPRMVALA